jgi:hypothetical protein
MNELHSRNAMIWIAVNLPLARVQISRCIKGGNVVRLPRWSSQMMKAMRRKTPEMRRATMSQKKWNSQYHKMFTGCRDSHGVRHFCGARLPCPSTNMIHTIAAVTNAAPIQSTLLSSFSLGMWLSLSIEKYPMHKEAAERPARKK